MAIGDLFDKKKIKKKTKMTNNERLKQTMKYLFLSPILVILFIYCQASLMELLVLSTTGNTFKVLGLPVDPDCLPYSLNCYKPIKKIPELTGFSYYIDKFVLSNIGLGRKKSTKPKTDYYPHLRNTTFNGAANKAKSFVDTTKFGWPYNWTDLKDSDKNPRTIKNSVGNFFTTLWVIIRGVMVGLLEALHQIFYENHRPPNHSAGSQIMDFAKFAIILPIINSLIFLGQYIATFFALMGACIKDQGFLCIPWLFFAAFSSAPIMIMTTIYLFLFLYKSSEGKIRRFREYGKRYKLLWAALIIYLWFSNIPVLWVDTKYKQASMIATAIPAVMLFLTAIGFASSI